MKPIAERIAECLTFLEGIRPGYKYTITIHKPYQVAEGDFWTTIASVVGESYKDKSYPHTFISVKLADFDKLPEAIQVESQKLIDADVESKRKGIESMQKEIEQLLVRGQSLLTLKNSLAA